MEQLNEKMAELEALADQHERLGDQISALERLRKELGGQISALLPPGPEKVELIAGDLKIVQQQVEQERTDSKLLREKYPTIAAECSKCSSYTRLTVTRLPRPDAQVLLGLAEFSAKVQHDPLPPRPKLQAPEPTPAPAPVPSAPARSRRRRRR